jgi:hypothetical protein
MQARIKRIDIESFKKNASAITKADQVNPVLSFIKIEVKGDFCCMTKSNLKAFVMQTTPNDSEDCIFLVDENTLFSFTELSDAEFINFQISGLRITIEDGRHKTQSPTENSNMYPRLELEMIQKWHSISKGVLDAIGTCAEIVFDDEISGLRNSVFVGRGSVAGSDASVGYWKFFEEDLPTIVLRKQVAMSVSKLPACEYSNNSSYDLFKVNTTLFGFSKSEIQFVELPPKFELPEFEKGVSFYINKSLLIKWNTYCINTCKSKALEATWNANLYRLELKIIDSKYEVNTDSYLDIVDGSGNFKFNPETINRILKVLPSEQIHFYPGKKNDRYYMTDNNKTFMAAIMLIN